MSLEIYKSRLFLLFQYWSRLHYVKYIFFSIILTIVLSIPAAVLFEILGLSDNELGGPQIKKYDIYEAIFIAIIGAPIFETLFCQMIPIKIIQNYVKWNTNKVAIIVSSILFALGHLSYSFWYFLLTLPIGFILSVTFIFFQKRKESSFWTTAIIHAGKNSLAIIFTFGELV